MVIHSISLAAIGHAAAIVMLERDPWLWVEKRSFRPILAQWQLYGGKRKFD